MTKVSALYLVVSKAYMAHSMAPHADLCLLTLPCLCNVYCTAGPVCMF